MAQLSLQERIKRSQELGQQANPTPVSQLQREAGIPGALTTAVSATALGGTPDQAKMMGTPAQKQAALQATVTATKTGETELEKARLFREQAVATGEEEEKKRKAVTLSQQLGTTGDRVNQLINNAVQNIESARATAVVATPPQTGAALSAEELSKKITINGTELTVTDALGRIANNDPLSQEMLAAINIATGKQLDPAQVPSLYQTALQQAQAAVTAGIQNTIGDTLTIGDLQGIGTSPEELVQILGLPNIDALNALTLPEFQNRLAALAQQFRETERVEAGLAQTSLLSSAERDALRETLRSLEETGVAGAESQVAELFRQVDANTNVEFGGKTYSIEEILNNETFNKLIEQVLESPTGDTAKQLEATEPKFLNWIKGVDAGLRALVTTATIATKTYGETQVANKTFLSPFAGQEKFLKELGPDYQALFGPRAAVLTKTDLDKTPALAVAYDLEQKKPGSGASALANLSQLPPKEIAVLSTAELSALGLDRENGLWSQYLKTVKTVNDINSVPDNQPEVFLDTLNIDQDLTEINALISEDMLAAALGYPGSNASDLDVNQDGKFGAEDIPGLKKQFTVDVPSLKDIVKAGTVPTPKSFQLQPLDVGGNALLGGLVSAFRDRVITDDELKKIDSLAFNADDAKALVDKNISGFPEAGAVNNTLAGILNRKIISEVNNKFSENGISVDGINQIRNSSGNINNLDQANAALSQIDGVINAVKNALSQAPSNASKAVIQQYLDVLQNTRNGIAGKQRDFQAAVDAAAAEQRRQAEDKVKSQVKEEVLAKQIESVLPVGPAGSKFIASVPGKIQATGEKAKKQLRKWRI